MIITVLVSILVSAIVTWAILCWYTWYQIKNMDDVVDAIEKIIDKKIELNNNHVNE
ncbi:hypothetical protein [Enterococcus dispar]|uniref:hypothetical protein n=1 Tax=Enterococcus dispar TaxID=44009 RepID=UPI00189FA5D0|nr:hypothetical protein [Enterococcus dispar]